MARATETPPAFSAGLGSRISRAPQGFYRTRGKRALDLALGIPLLVLLTPFILCLAAMTALVSGWPPFHVSKRVGQDGREFSIWKIRTMVKDAESVLADWRRADMELGQEYGAHFKLLDDPRVTRWGGFLRRTSLDELPQIWNVVRGEMSLVGPRPISGEELALYGDDRCEFLSSKPGITGLWQVSGRNAIGYPDRIDIELDYCRSVNLRQDFNLLLRTLPSPFWLNGR